MEKKKVNKINKEIYTNIISIGENDYCDYKSSKIKCTKLIESINGFANGDGGEIYIGIKEKKEGNRSIIGYENDGFKKIDETEELMGVYNKISPSITGLDHSFLAYENKYILKFSIPGFNNNTLYYTPDRRCFIRKGTRNMELKGEDIEKLKFIKGIKKYEENIIDIDFNIILNSLYFKKFINKENRYGNFLSDFNYLYNNNFIDKNKLPRVSTILGFLDNPQVHLKAGITINVYGFQKNSRNYKYDRNRVENTLKVIGPIEVLIKNSLNFIKKHFIDNQINYSLIAIKEAIVNSIIHREYSIQDDIKIEIFDNQIEITNPGFFPGNDKNINPLKFQRNARNPKLYWILSRISDFEPNPEEKLNQDRGEGIKTIWNLAKKLNYSNPKYEFKNGNTTIILNFASIKTYDNKILDYIKSSGSIANKEAREITGEEDKEKIKNVFKRLERNKKIERVDKNAPKSKTRYKLTDNSKSIVSQKSLF